MLLLLIICLFSQSDFFNCDKDVNEETDLPELHQQYNIPEFNNPSGIPDTYLKSSITTTAEDDNHEFSINTKLTEDRIMRETKDDKRLRTSVPYLTQRDHKSSSVLQKNPHLDNHDYVLPFSSYSSSQNLLSITIPTQSSINRRKYTPNFEDQRNSFPSRLNEDFDESTNSSEFPVTYTPSPLLNLFKSSLTSKIPEDPSRRVSFTSGLLPKGSTVNISPFSTVSAKVPVFRRMLSTINQFELIFGKEMAGFFGMDKFVMTHSVVTRIPTKKRESHSPSSIQTTELTRPIARMHYMPKRKINTTKQFNIINPTKTMTINKKPTVDFLIGVLEATNATTIGVFPGPIPIPTRVKSLETPTTPHLDPGILTATAKQEQFFSEDRFGFLQIGTTPVFDEHTRTTIVEGRPVYIPHEPTRPTTAGDVYHGEIKVVPPTALPPLHAYHQMMEALDEGYMMVFLLELCKQVALKPAHHVQDVITHTEMIVNELLEKSRLGWFGRPLLDISLQLSIFVTEAEIDVKKSYAAMMYHMLMRRKQELSAEVNSIIDYADLMYKRVEGEHLFHVLKEFEEFPNVTLNGYWLCDSLIEAFLRPYRRLQYSPRRQTLLDSINKALKTRFPNFSFRRPREKDVNTTETSPPTSTATTPVITMTYKVTRKRHVRKRRRRRKRRRKHHPHSHRHRQGRRYNHTRVISDKVIFF